MYGIKFAGMPFGSSNNKPDLWAPIGLKYRKIQMRQVSSDFATSDRIFSTNNLLVPYGLVVLPVGSVSSIGTLLGVPYTVALLLKTRLLTFSFFITRKSVNTLETLFV